MTIIWKKYRWLICSASRSKFWPGKLSKALLQENEVLPQVCRGSAGAVAVTNTISLSLANFVGSVVGFLNVLVIRLRSLLLAASLSFEREMV
jgi:hypothetical protein